MNVGVMFMNSSLEIRRNLKYFHLPYIMYVDIYQKGLVFPALTLMLSPFFVLPLCAVLCVRQKFFPVLEPQQAHARALRRAALQMRLLQQGKRRGGETKPCGFPPYFMVCLTRVCALCAHLHAN